MKDHGTGVNPVKYLPFNVITVGDGHKQHKQHSK